MSKHVIIQAGKKQSFTPAEKIEILGALEKSDLSLSKFARRIGVSKATLCTWRQGLNRGNLCPDIPESLEIAPMANLETKTRDLEATVKRLSEEIYSCHAFIGREVMKRS